MTVHQLQQDVRTTAGRNARWSNTALAFLPRKDGEKCAYECQKTEEPRREKESIDALLISCSAKCLLVITSAGVQWSPYIMNSLAKYLSAHPSTKFCFLYHQLLERLLLYFFSPGNLASMTSCMVRFCQISSGSHPILALSPKPPNQ